MIGLGAGALGASKALDAGAPVKRSDADEGIVAVGCADGFATGRAGAVGLDLTLTGGEAKLGRVGGDLGLKEGGLGGFFPELLNGGGGLLKGGGGIPDMSSFLRLRQREMNEHAEMDARTLDARVRNSKTCLSIDAGSPRHR